MRRLLTTLLSLLLLLAVAAPAGATWADRLATPRPPYASLTYDGAAELARRFDAILATLPDDAFAVITTPADLEAWIAEVVPFFGYEGITGPDYDAAGYRYPTRAVFASFDDRGSRGQNHILGMANCVSGELWLNGRFANPASSWYESRATLGVLVHELAHVQGICWGGNSEQSAQMVTLEVLAAMSVKGNRAAFASLIDELQGMTLSAAYGLAIAEGRVADYQTLADALGDDAFAEAAVAKTTRYWAADPEELGRILRLYNVEPAQSLVSAIYQGDCAFRSPAWDSEANEVAYPLVEFEAPCVLGVQLPINQGVFAVPLGIDDSSHIWDHAEDLAAAFAVVA